MTENTSVSKTSSSANYVPANGFPAGLEYLDDLPPEVKYRSFFGRGDKRFAVYPPGWNLKKDGKAFSRGREISIPIGFVYADDEFLAARRACDLGMNPMMSELPVVVEVANSGKSN